MRVVSIERPRVQHILEGLPDGPDFQAMTPEDEAILEAADSFRVYQAECELLRLGEHAVDEIRRELAETHGLRHQALVNALWHYGDEQDIPVFVEEFTKGTEQRRERAVQFLAGFEHPGALRVLREALKDTSAEVRTLAIHGFAARGRNLPASCRHRLMNDADPRVRLAALDAVLHH